MLQWSALLLRYCLGGLLASGRYAATICFPALVGTFFNISH